MSVTDADRETEELLQYLQGHIHQDKVHDAARRAMLSDATGGFFDEHLFRETLRAAANAIAAWNKRASPAPEPVAAMEPVADPLMYEVRDMLIRCAGEMSYVQGMLEAMEQSDNRRDTIARLSRTCDALGELFHKLGERK